jgi:hypothetical protein
MAMSSSPKSSAVTIYAHAALEAGFKACCMKSGAYDGANRNYYFQGVGGGELEKSRLTVIARSISDEAIRTFLTRDSGLLRLRSQ